MLRDQRSPRPPITRKNPVGHSSISLALWLPLSLWERGLGGEVRGERNVSSPRTLPARAGGLRGEATAQPVGAASAASPLLPKNSPPTGHITPSPDTTRQLHNFSISAMLGCSALRLPLPAQHPITISNHQQPQAPSQPNKRASATCSPDQAQVTPRLTPPRPRPILTVHALV